MKNTLTADTSAQKYFSCAVPNGCRRSGARRPRTSPTLSNTWLPTSASEWIVSAKSVGDPVTNQPNALDTAIAEFVAMERLTDADTEIRSEIRSNQNGTSRCADLAAAEHDPFAARQTLEPDRPARVELVRRNAD